VANKWRTRIPWPIVLTPSADGKVSGRALAWRSLPVVSRRTPRLFPLDIR